MKFIYNHKLSTQDTFYAVFTVYKFRLYPVAIGTVRTLSQDIQLHGYRIPAGVSKFYNSL